MIQMRLIIGFIILALGLIGFILSVIFLNLAYGLMILIISLLIWLIVINDYQKSGYSHIIGNVFLYAGVAVSLVIFLSRGLQTNYFGGKELDPEGTVIALIVLFFSIVTGFIFYHFSMLERNIKELREQMNRWWRGE